MAVDVPTLQLDPYKPQVPIPMMAPVDTQPTGSSGPLPLQAGFMGKSGSIADIVNEGFRGFMRGHEQLAQRKSQQASYALDLAQTNESNAWKTYEDALGTGKAKPGDKNDPAYTAYLAAHTATDDVMKKIAIPDEKPKGQKGQKKKTDSTTADSTKPQGFAAKFSEFMKANPHLIPQALITARVPRPPSMTAQAQETQNKLTQQQQDITLGGQNIDANRMKMKEQQEEIDRAAQERAVEEAGGYDKVLADPNATPEQKQTASRMKYTALDKESPEGKIKLGLEQDVLNGNDKNWTPGQRQLAGTLGISQQPQEVTITGKNGHQQMIMVDPRTNQPVPGSKPLDLGTPQWAQQFYAQRSAMKTDLHKAIAANPAHYGVQLTGDKKTDDARIDAATEVIFTDQEEGIRSAANATGKTAYEVTRDNEIIADMRHSMDSQISGKADSTTDFKFPGEDKPRSLSRDQVDDILGQFMTFPNDEHPGMNTFRSTPQFMPGKDAATLERERRWAYQLAEDRMMVQKGKKAMTKEAADAILNQTILGKPITAQDVPEPPKKQQGSSWMTWLEPWTWGQGNTSGQGNAMQGPPTGASQSATEEKVYVVNGQLVKDTPEVANKWKSAGYIVQEATPEQIQQATQQ